MVRKISWYVTLFVHPRRDDIEVKDDATNEEIDQLVLDEVFNHIEWGWEENKESDKHCYGCKHLNSSMDGAGGITYGCNLCSGLVIGEDAHWSRDEDKPRRCEKYEKRESKWD